MQLFEAPELDLDDDRVIDEIAQLRAELSGFLRVPKRWQGGLRRSTQAKAIQGSNSIEGYTVTDADAAAAMLDDEPLSADEQTWREIQAYRQLMTFVLAMAPQASFTPDAQTLRTMHFMLLNHDLTKSPGQYRTGAIYVQNNRGEAVYEGPDAAIVSELMDSFVAQLLSPPPVPTLVAAAMAHLNLVMIHPFRDGNGRMARAVQTMVLAKDEILEPTFSSIEEWLGSNTNDYYRALAVTGAGAWHPERSAHLWVKFNLRAHHMQAQTMRRRFADAERTLTHLQSVIDQKGLQDRMLDALHLVTLGFRVSRPSYVDITGAEERTATRDLAQLASLELLEAHGQTRGRYYTAGPELRTAMEQLHAGRRPLTDPYPHLLAELHLPRP